LSISPPGDEQLIASVPCLWWFSVSRIVGSKLLTRFGPVFQAADTMTTTAKPTRKKTSDAPQLLTIADVAQKLDMSYHEARNFLVRVPMEKTGSRGAHLYTLEAITEARKTSAQAAANEAQPETKEWHEVEKNTAAV